MKITNMLLCSAVAGAVTLSASKATAQPPPPPALSTSLPLKLTSISGTATVTAHYDGLKTTTPYNQVSFNYKTILKVISHQVYLNNSIIVPPHADLIFDPISGETYLTNSLGFHYNLAGICHVEIYQRAASFKGTFYNGSESDLCYFEFQAKGTGIDGLYYNFDIYDTGKLTAKYSGNVVALLTKTSAVRMSLSLQNGGGVAEIAGSEPGVISDCQFTFTGIGNAPSGVFPYAANWGR